MMKTYLQMTHEERVAYLAPALRPGLTIHYQAVELGDQPTAKLIVTEVTDQCIGYQVHWDGDAEPGKVVRYILADFFDDLAAGYRGHV